MMPQPNRLMVVGSTIFSLARGQTVAAVEQTLSALDSDNWLIVLASLRHIDIFDALAGEPAVAERLRDLEAEAQKAGEEVWEYIVEHNVQL
jgi:hypothetical protein